MHYVAVAPLAVSRRDTYTYRTDSEVPAGTVVAIPYAGRQGLGVVMEAAGPDERAKRAVPTEERLPAWQLRFGRGLAEAYLAPLGQTMGLFLPKWRGGPAAGFAETGSKSAAAASADRRRSRPEIRIGGAAGLDGLVLVPERAMLKQFTAEGPCFSGTAPVPERRDIWEQVRNGTAKPVFGTRSALFLPWKRLDQVVVLHEDELGHQNDRTPRYHAREAARLLAEAHGARLILASPAPSLRAWELAGLPQAKAGAEAKAEGAASPTLISPKYDGFDDPLPHGFIEKLAELPGPVLVHTVQSRVRQVRDAVKASGAPGAKVAGLSNITVGGQSTVLAGKRYGSVVTLGIDAILARPGFMVTERAVALLRKLGGILQPNGPLLVYSKHRDHPAFAALSKPYGTFLQEEMRDREALSLPPVRPLVRISTAKDDRPKIEKALGQSDIDPRRVRYATEDGSLTVLIKGDPKRLRGLISPERRIGVEY
ncbi:MAG: hypothetical protein Q8Q11_02555 [bacterium]|nr:hypothetical protein [bacterium]MDZ4248010.1 hypothetical protein [Patescibacteria group bacterium]